MILLGALLFTIVKVGWREPHEGTGYQRERTVCVFPQSQFAQDEGKGALKDGHEKGFCASDDGGKIRDYMQERQAHGDD